MIIQPQPKLI